MAGWEGGRRIRRRGFSLIELLASVAVMLVLVALLLPVVGRLRRAAARTRCTSQARQIHGGWRQRVEDERRNREALDWPLMTERNWRSTLLAYAALERKLFRSPGDPEYLSRTDWGTPGGHFFLYSNTQGGRAFGMPFDEVLGNYKGTTAAEHARFEEVKTTSGPHTSGWHTMLFDYFIHFATPDTFIYRSPPPMAGLGREELHFRARGMYGASFDFRVTVGAVDPQRETATVSVVVTRGATGAFSGIFFENGAGLPLWGRALEQGVDPASTDAKKYNVAHNRATQGLIHGTDFGYWDKPIRRLDSETPHTGGMYHATWEIPMVRSSYEINPQVFVESVADGLREHWVIRTLGAFHDGKRTVAMSDGSVRQEPP